MQPITPYLTINGADKALEFYQKAFGATDIFRHPGEDGRLFHARMTINGGIVMMSADYSKDHGGPPAPTPDKTAPVAASIALDSPEKVDAIFAQPSRRVETASCRRRTCSGAIASRSSSIRSVTAGCWTRR